MNPWTVLTTAGTIWSLMLVGALASDADKPDKPRRPIDGIMDNSFLVEEAYNQEPGVVQHIFNGLYGVDRTSNPQRQTLDMSFTQEWPVFSQTHQFSYTVPYSFVWESGKSDHSLDDIFLNYRYQAYLDEKTLTAFAPRFSLLLPTGNQLRGSGNGTVGYQWNLPFSTTFGDRWFMHLNAGLTYLPAGAPPAQDRLDYNLGASAIYCVSDRFNLMLEWVGYWNQILENGNHLERQLYSVVSPGFRYAFNFQNSSQLVLGLGVPIGLTTSSPEVGALVYVSYEHNLFGKRK